MGFPLRMSAVFLIGAACLSAACSSLPGLKAARQANFAALRQTLASEHLSPDQVRRLSREVLSAEIVRAKDREDRPFVRSLRGCASPLYPALDERSKKKDGVGAEAAMLLLEGNRLSGNARKYKNAEDGAWRALAARSSQRDDELRQKYFADPDERVRQAALLAALEARDRRDAPELLEVSRLDPDPISRNRAFQALALIGGERITVALVDRYKVAEEEQRLAIVDAWGKPGLYEAGGKKQLVRLLTQDAGFETLHAAHMLAQDEDETIRNLALGRLVQISREGTAEERRMAIRFLPSTEPLTEKRLLELTKAEDREVAVIAWARLLGSAKHRDRAQAILLDWAKPGSIVAFQARSALAAGGDERVLPFMSKQMRAQDAATRLAAGRALIRLGALSEMAPLLADKEEEVRRTLACQVLARPYLTEDDQR